MSFSAYARNSLRYLPLLGSAVLLILIVRNFNGYGLLTSINLPLLLLALGISLFLNLFFASFKWWLVIISSGIKARFSEILKLLAGLLPATFFAPFQSGHLLYALGLRNAKKVSTFRAFECVAYDKWLSLVGTFLLIALGQVIIPGDHALSHPLILLASVAVVLIFFADRLVFRLLGRFRYFRQRSFFLQHPMGIWRKLGLLLCALVYQCSDTISMYFACLGLGLEINPKLLFGAFPVILLLTYLPVSISGFGVRENLIVFFFASALTYDQAISSGLVVDLLEYIAPALFGIMALPHTLRILGDYKRTKVLQEFELSLPDGGGASEEKSKEDLK